jgi:Domain of unknown function (DUF6602)
VRHEHHEWLRRVERDLQDEYETIREDLAGKPKNIQRSGHRAEAVWVRLLSDWLPPQYARGIGIRKHLLLEQEVERKVRKGKRKGEVEAVSRSDEVDVVVFHPSYPEALRKRNEILISGVVAAFSAKLSLTPRGLKDAVDDAILLRRGMKIRPGSVIGDLVSPLIVGVLAQSFDLGNSPHGAVDNILQVEGRQKIGHPREELDLVCVADLNCWRRHPAIHRGHPIPAPGQYLAYWSSGPTMATVSPPPVAVAAFIAEFWRKLANRDLSLKPIADGLGATYTAGPSAGSGEFSVPLAGLIEPETYPNLPPAVRSVQLID